MIKVFGDNTDTSDFMGIFWVMLLTHVDWILE